MRLHLATLALRLSIATAIGVALIGPSGSASAGGWAVASLDSLPTVTAGEAARIGFTILQHGVRPAELTDGVGVEIVREDGSVASFPARGDGVAGHYVATVTFPTAADTYQWSIRMGWFGEHDLGTLTVGAATDEPKSSPWHSARWVMLAATVALGAMVLVDLAFGRRRQTSALA
jgi:hypothetical protein